jgi:hypothetical protein
MNLSPPKSQQHPQNATSLPIILPDDIIAELLSFLPVKSLMQFKCVCKSWKILISDSSFVKFHFKRSTQNPQLALVYLAQYAETAIVSAIPLSHFLVSLSKPVTLTNDPYFRLKDKDCFSVVGSCNGFAMFVWFC